MAKNSSFDLDFGYGVEGESLVGNLLTGDKTVEVKRDRKWYKTNNLYIETECYFVGKGAWAPSGLMVTTAEYWAFVIEQSVIMVPTETLKFAVKEFGREVSCEIPPNLSKGYLITAENLLTATRLCRE